MSRADYLPVRWLYAIRCDEVLALGSSIDVLAYLETLEECNPVPVALEALWLGEAQLVERSLDRLKSIMSDYHLRGQWHYLAADAFALLFEELPTLMRRELQPIDISLAAYPHDLHDQLLAKIREVAPGYAGWLPAIHRKVAL